MEYIIEKSFEDKNYTVNRLGKAEYEKCVFNKCDFSESDMSGLRFIECEFVDCNLSNTKLYETSIQDTVFTKCKLLGLQFDTCNEFNFSANFDNCNLNYSVFNKMELGKSSFKDCQLHQADFTEAVMKKTKLKKCDLLNATFDRTNLEKADLTDTINYNIDPEINYISKAKFSMPDVIRLLDKYNIEID